MKVMVIPKTVGLFGAVMKGLEKKEARLKIGRRCDSIQTTVLLRSTIIFGRVLKTWGDCQSDSQARPLI